MGTYCANCGCNVDTDDERRRYCYNCNRDGYKIYAIRNNINGRLYIGSTKRSLIERFYRHKYCLNSGTHHCLPLQLDWITYGEKSFNVFIIENIDITNPFRLQVIEQAYIDRYGRESIYNMSPACNDHIISN